MARIEIGLTWGIVESEFSQDGWAQTKYHIQYELDMSFKEWTLEERVPLPQIHKYINVTKALLTLVTLQLVTPSRMAKPPLLLPNDGPPILLSHMMRTTLLFRHAQHLRALVDVVGTTKEHINLLKRDPLRLGYEPPHKGCEADVHRHEEEHALQALLLEEDGEELVEDGLGDVLRLRAHPHRLGAHVHGEDLGRPNPDRGAPAGLVEEDEEKEQEDDADADGLGLGVRARRCEADDGDEHRAECHSNGTDDEQPATPKPIDGPNGVEGEEDAAGGIESVDEVDGLGGGPHFLVDGSRVGVQGSLAGKLLAHIKDNSKVQPLANGRILEKGTIAR